MERGKEEEERVVSNRKWHLYLVTATSEMLSRQLNEVFRLNEAASSNLQCFKNGFQLRINIQIRFHIYLPREGIPISVGLLSLSWLFRRISSISVSRIVLMSASFSCSFIHNTTRTMHCTASVFWSHHHLPLWIVVVELGS